MGDSTAGNALETMRQLTIIFLISILFTVDSWGQRNIGKQIDKERRQEFADSKERKKIEELFSRQSITLTEFEKELNLKIQFRDSTYHDLPPRNERQDPDNWYFYYQVWRNLDFNVKQLVRGVITTKFWFDFNLLIRNDTIIGVKVSESGRDLYDHVFESKFYSFVNDHEKFYNTKIKDYRSELGPFNFENFGTYVGLHQSLLRDCGIMIDAFENENRSLLRKWLTSMNPEKQAYAVQGFYYLEKHKGQRPTKEEQRLIDHVKSLTRDIHVNPMIKTNELLSSDYFDKAYIELKERGHIKDGD